jgi:uncharacterized protein YkwD
LRKLFFFLFLLTNYTAFSQLNESVVESAFVQALNEFREQQGLTVLERQADLDAVAFDQAEYMLKAGRLVHEQDNSKKAKLNDRLLYYSAFYAEAGENIAELSLGGKLPVEPAGQKVPINSAEQVAAAVLTEWRNEEESKLNLIDPHYRHFGLSFLEEEGKVYSVLIMAGLPYDLSDDKGLKDVQGLEPYKKEICDKFIDEHPTFPELFSDVLTQEGNEVFLELNNLAYVEALLAGAGDALAVDVICNEQFHCGEPNRLFPGGISDGYLMSPIKKGKLAVLNLRKEQGEVKVSMGKLPDLYQGDHCELNLISIKEGHHCQTARFNKVVTTTEQWFDLPFLLIGDSVGETMSWIDTSAYSIALNNSVETIKEEIDALAHNLKKLNYQAKSVSITIKSSPIQNTSVIEEISSYLLSTLKPALNYQSEISISNSIDWKAYGKFQENTFYQLETRGLDTAGIIAYLNKTAKDDNKLNTFLDSLNMLTIHYRGEANLPLDGLGAEYEKIFTFLRQSGKQKEALNLQKTYIEKGHGKLAENYFQQRKKQLPFISNNIAAHAESGADSYDGNTIYKAFLELFLINSSLPQLRYNTLIAQLKDWVNGQKINNVDDWEDEFNKLNGQIDKTVFNRAMMNYQAVAADHYFDKKQFAERKKAFDDLVKRQRAANLAPVDALHLARYLSLQDQFSKAAEVLKPYIRTENPPAELLSYYLQIAIYDREVNPEKLYRESLDKLASLYPQEYCRLFSKEKMGIQSLKDYSIKAKYCEVCQ